MIGEITEIAKKLPLNRSRLVAAVDQRGETIFTSDKSNLRGGQLNLPMDTPANSFVVVSFESEHGDIESQEFRVVKNNPGGVIVDQESIPPIVGIMVKERVPFVSAGNTFDFSTTGDGDFGATLNYPLGMNVTGGNVTVITQKMLGNYKSSLTGFR